MIKRLCTKNWHLKLFAIIMAAIFWFALLGTRHAPRWFTEEVEIKAFNLADTLVIASEIPRAKLKILVQQEDLRRVSSDDFDVYIDMRNVEIGTATSPVYVTSKNSRVSVVEVLPKTVTVKVDEKFVKEILVSIDIEGKPSEKYEVKSIRASPEKVLIEGGQSGLSEIRALKGKFILTGSEKSNFVSHVTPSTDQSGRPLERIKIVPETIKIDVEIIPSVGEKTVPIKPKFTGSLKSGSIEKISVKPTVISIEGEAKVLEKINSLDTEPIDLEKIQKSSTAAVKLKIPPNIKTQGSDFAEVTIELSNAKEP